MGKNKSKQVSINKKVNTHDYVQSQAKYMSASDMIEEITISKVMSRLILIITCLLFAVIVWMSLTVVEEVAIAKGEIIPEGKIAQIQHLEGGIISSIHVEEGDLVEQGQKLISLLPTASISELEQMKSRRLALKLDIKRLSDFTKKMKEMENSGEQKGVEAEELANTRKKLLESENTLLEFQLEEQKAQRDILLAKLSQFETEQTRLSEQVNLQVENLALLEKEIDMMKNLVQTGAASKGEYIKLQREHNRAVAKLKEYKSDQAKNKQEIKETSYKIDELDANLYAESLEKLNEVSAELTELEHVIKKLEDKVYRLEVRAPVAGFVKGQKVSIGKVVMPGEVLMEVVPTNIEMQVEVKINPKDVGGVKIGDEVHVKVTAYDYAQYGYLEGHLKAISASTFLDPQNMPFYKGIVQLERQTLNTETTEERLLPGMVVDADIITGRRTILNYLLTPILKVKDNSFKER